MQLSPVSPEQILPYAASFLVFLLVFIAKWLNDLRKYQNSENQIELKMKSHDAKYQEQLQETITELNGKYTAQTEFYSEMLRVERKESRELIERIAVLEDRVDRLIEDKRRAEEQRDKAIQKLRDLTDKFDIIKRNLDKSNYDLRTSRDTCKIVIAKRDDEIQKLYKILNTKEEKQSDSERSVVTVPTVDGN